MRAGVTMIDKEKGFDNEIEIEDEKSADDETSYKFKMKTSPRLS